MLSKLTRINANYFLVKLGIWPLYFMRVTHDSITIYTIITVHSGFSLVESRAQLENRRTANAISVTSQSRLFENFEQPIAFFVLYRSCQTRKSFRRTTKLCMLCKIFNFLLYKNSPRRLVHHFCSYHVMASYCLSITEQLNVIYLLN